MIIFIIKLSTPTENTLWQIYSVYRIKEESYYIKTDFSGDEYDTWLKDMVKRSEYKFNTSVNKDDKTLTLSSCYDTNGTRVVVHAKLIKKEAR